MRHKKSRNSLNRFTSWYEATLKSLARSVVIHQSIRTSLQKAKAVKPLVEKLIRLAKENTLAGKREAFRTLGDHALVSVLFNEIGPRFSKRDSGFTRTINLGRRRGDNAQVVVFELTEIKKKEVKKPKKAKAEAVETQGAVQEQASEEKKHEIDVAVKEKPPVTKRPAKKFLGGLKNIFKKERDAL